MCKKLPTAPHPSKVLGELNRASSILRDVFNDTFSGIHIDDETLYQETKDYVQEIAPSKQSIVKFYQSKKHTDFRKVPHRETNQNFVWKNRFHDQGSLFDHRTYRSASRY